VTEVRNPVFAGILGDPFVLRHAGEYYAYGTPADGPVPVLRSRDLVRWEAAGEALAAPAPGLQTWAPEVARAGGRFWMYHSVGSPEGEGHRLSVAVADRPLGPFRPTGEPLFPAEGFTIDAHPFRAPDGAWYLFFCRDWLEGERPGTGIAVARLRDMATADPDWRTVVRPHAEWHVYERGRHWYDRVWEGWYTVEGPFVVVRGGRLWCFFSGGAWRRDNYGVAYAVADEPLGPWHAEPSDGPSVLRTVPGEIIGPGHASIVDAPDLIAQEMVYHAWDAGGAGRTMRVDPLRWTPAGPVVRPTVDPRDPPPAADLVVRFDDGWDDAAWTARGRWTARAGEAIGADGEATLRRPLTADGVVEAWLGPGAALSIGEADAPTPALRLQADAGGGPALRRALVRLAGRRLDGWIDGRHAAAATSAAPLAVTLVAAAGAESRFGPVTMTDAGGAFDAAADAGTIAT
jgi:GH43 family beta-xylosidase